MKRSYWKPQIMQAAAKATGCSPQSDSNSPLLKTAPLEFIQKGNIYLVPTQKAIINGTGRYSAHYQRRNINTNPIRNLCSTMDSSLQDTVMQ